MEEIKKNYDDDIYITAAEAMRILKLRKVPFTSTIARDIFRQDVFSGSGKDGVREAFQGSPLANG